MSVFILVGIVRGVHTILLLLTTAHYCSHTFLVYALVYYDPVATCFTLRAADSGCYYHECLLRCLPKLTCLIRRLPPNLGKATPHPAGEPNFYRISEVYPLPPIVPRGAGGLGGLGGRGGRGGNPNPVVQRAEVNTPLAHSSSAAATSSAINQVSGNQVSGNQVSGNQVSGNQVSGNNEASTIKVEGSAVAAMAAMASSSASSRRESLDSMSPSLHSPQSSPPQETANYAMSNAQDQDQDQDQDSTTMSPSDSNASHRNASHRNAPPTISAAPEVHFHAPPSHTAPPNLPNPPNPPPLNPPPPPNNNDVEPIAYRSPSIRPLSEEYSVGFAAGLAHAAATMDRQRSPRMQLQLQQQQHQIPTNTMPPLMTAYSQDRGYRVHERQLVDRQLVDRQLVDRQLVDRQLVDRQLDRHLEQPLLPSGHGGELYHPSRYLSNYPPSSSSTSGYSTSQYPVEYGRQHQQRQPQHSPQLRGGHSSAQVVQVRPATLYRHRSHQPTPTQYQSQHQYQHRQQRHPSPSDNSNIGPGIDEQRAHMNYEQTHALNTTTTPGGGGPGGDPGDGPSGVGPSGQSGPPRPNADTLAMQGRSKSCPDHFVDRQQQRQRQQQQQQQREVSAVNRSRSPVIEPIPYARVDNKDDKMVVNDSPVVHKHNV
eukprot:CAMPEP_0201622056 /NCGR_PEP_ID=MMETSP0492-20130828/47207_1 /ASSEMBLY_ACC=CAM_ASM_000837 /TAXON_ID=420259 /ORGANISM="Thalassiosira gravida, Strain GMp14c1" /LENGTH=650 /DNA_ID=CAMNT_0048091629 /DNA_START=464 /DNA_END=2417 /DNA_ORIENTATION=-